MAQIEDVLFKHQTEDICILMRAAQDPFDSHFTGLPKIAAQRDFWEEERQALRAKRQT